MKKVAIYPGTFDPLTRGHVDLIQRAARLFDEVVVAVATSERKTPMFDAPTRLRFCVESLVKVRGVRVALLDGLLVEFARMHQADFVVRGMRTADDVTYELANASMNRQLSKDALETIFLPANDAYIHVSATMVREIIALGGDVSLFVPEQVLKCVKVNKYDVPKNH